MPTLGKPKPRFLRSVPKPANVGAQELSKAEPVYIAGLPEGSDTPTTIADVDGLQAILTDLEDRVAALEASDTP